MGGEHENATALLLDPREHRRAACRGRRRPRAGHASPRRPPPEGALPPGSYCAPPPDVDHELFQRSPTSIALPVMLIRSSASTTLPVGSPVNSTISPRRSGCGWGAEELVEAPLVLELLGFLRAMLSHVPASLPGGTRSRRRSRGLRAVGSATWWRSHDLLVAAHARRTCARLAVCVRGARFPP